MKILIETNGVPPQIASTQCIDHFLRGIFRSGFSCYFHENVMNINLENIGISAETYISL